MARSQITYQSLSALKPNARNPRTHSKRQLRQIADSIRQFGFTNPVLVGADDAIIAGHGRVEAAKLLGLSEVPTIRLDRLSEAEKRAYVIADNRLAELAGWDRELLAVELQYLTELDLSFDLTITGFETAEIDLLIQELAPGALDAAADAVPAVDPAAAPVSRLGDLWILDRHRLLCGDATKTESYERLMVGQRAQMVFIDPPYNVAIDGHVTGLGAIRHREFVMASGEMTEGEFVAFLKSALANLAAHSIDGSIHFVCMDWRHAFEVLTAGRATYAELKNLVVWNKDNGGMGTFYRSKHELIFAFKSGSAPHINNFELGQHGRYRTNVWDYAGINSLRAGRLEELQMHPTVKPVGLVADAILDCSKRGGIVLDSFVGSGTTIIAAERTGRKAYALELDPVYADTAVKRWQTYTGQEAVHAETGLSYAAMAIARGEAADCNTVSGATSCIKSAELVAEVEVANVQ